MNSVVEHMSEMLEHVRLSVQHLLESNLAQYYNPLEFGFVQRQLNSDEILLERAQF